MEQAETKTTLQMVGLMESVMRQKQISHRKGPHVEPWPGPMSGRTVVDREEFVEVPYTVLM